MLSSSGCQENATPTATRGQASSKRWADVLVVDGDPTVDLGVLKDPVRNLVLIVKDGVIHKNTL